MNKQRMAEAVIGLGSNIGDGKKNLLKAWSQLGKHKDISLLSLSSPYLSEPVGMQSEHWFTNAVGVLETELPPENLLFILLDIEASMGRKRNSTKTSPTDRTVDLDLLYYAEQIVKTKKLVIPHPEVQSRLFVLAPLAELLPDKRHPANGMSSIEMLHRLASSDGNTPGQHVKRMIWQEIECKTDHE